MRIRRLVVEGFGPFAGRQEVDFAALEAAGLFLITGRTGSGKSSLLDAICFALYGSAPRYEGMKGRLRSDHARLEDPTRVELEFDAQGEQYRVVRSPEYERPKKRGDGTTLQREEAQVFRRQDGEWAGLAARAVDVAEVLDPVLQLSREQFLQVILLAQGRFQQFLRARSEDRVGLLRALFGTERFERFEQELVQRAKALEQTVAAATQAVAGDLARLGDVAGLDEAPALEHLQQLLAGLEADAARAAAEDADARAAFGAADRRLAELVRVAELQRRRDAAEAELAMLDARQGDLDAARGRLLAAQHALPATPAADRADRSAAASLRAARARAAAEQEAGGPVADPASAAADLDAALGALAGPLADEAALPTLQAALARADAALVRAQHALEAATTEAERIPAERDEATAARSRAAVLAATLPGAQQEVQRTTAVAGHARTAERLRTDAATADRALSAALSSERDAADAVRRLVDARAAGAAGLLAASLADGEPCPVCGALEHPAPARQGAERVDDDAVAAAQARQDAAVAARSAAAERASAMRARLAAAEAAAGGADTATAERATAEARSAADAATEARAEELRQAARVQAIDERADAAAARIEQRRSAVGQQQAQRVQAAEQHAAADARVVSARGDAASVAVRTAQLRERREVLRRLAAAIAAEAAAVADSADAARALETALAEAGFAGTAELRAAALPTAERESLAARIRAHEDRHAAAAGQLADPAVAAVQAEPADVDAGAARKQEALQLQHRTGRAEADLSGRLAQATALAARIIATGDAVAADREQLQVLAPLAAVVRGTGGNTKRMRLEAYVLASRLEQIVAAANVRLATMTGGQYTLRHDDTPAERNAHSGLGLDVMDEHTGRPRSIASLSGGETFLASLALALGLAEVVSEEAGGVRLDTLFVDEGFGSLDRQTLDTAMETLDGLRAGGRVVGLISHVEAMQEDIPAGLHVERGPDGASTVRMRSLAPLG